ncbi:MAG: helix-turn-helix transcriptional regulator [Oscillospiraceae bacterium]|nr:helix-turn-helix transcriptional regulator [Oscillospiraceae bacterium]
MEEFIPTPLAQELDVTHIVTLHDFNYTPDFLFTGESHNFWELAFIRRGSVGVMAGSTGYTLGSGEAIFHSPNEYHNIWANGASAEVIIISFVCSSPCMRFFEKRMLTLSPEEIEIVEKLLSLGSRTFTDPPDILYQKKLNIRPNAKSSNLQLLKLYLEELLISLMQNAEIIDRMERKSESAGTRNDRLITDSIIKTLTEHIYGNTTLDEVCAGVLFSKSHLKTLFKKNTGYSIMDYYTHLKIERAKILIKEGELSISDIAELLGYASIHYFSRVFKLKVGMSPTEYKKS